MPNLPSFIHKWIIPMATVAVHIFCCPFTKVEESFNIQAIHDILHYKSDINKYDHLEFPGVVPRTFIGPLMVSLLASPFVFLSNFLKFNKMAEQYIVRLTLGSLVIIAFIRFTRAVQAIFGDTVSTWLIWVTVTQFHFMFYASRTLPNTFAVAIVLLALSYWLNQNHDKFIWSSACAIILFRTELCLFLGLILLQDLISRRLHLSKLLRHAIPAGIVWLGLTVLVDSYFWRRYLWPEGEVFWYNTILNKSSNWGTSPFLWYFSSAIPRVLLASVVFIPVGLYLDRRLMTILVPSIVFVFLFSFLPHKELRFIIYVFPMFNVAAAVGCTRLCLNKNKSWFQFALAIGAYCHLVANLTATSGFLYVAHFNYPGGNAITKLHDVVPGHLPIHVHIDVYTAQTGVTRFTQLHDHWIYNKTENLDLESDDLHMFSHMILGISHVTKEKMKSYHVTHTVLSQIFGYSKVKFNIKRIPPAIVEKTPHIWILQRHYHQEGHY